MGRINRLWRLLAIIALSLVSLTSSVFAQDQGNGRIFVGNISGLENIDAKFAAVVADNGRAVAFVASQDPTWNAANSKWFVGEATAGTLMATANDGTSLTGSLVGDRLSGNIGGLPWVGTLAQSGVAGLYRTRFGDEVQVAIVLSDGSWVATSWSALTGRLLRSWNSGTGMLEQVSRYTVRIQPEPAAPMVELSQVLPTDDADAAWQTQPWQ